MREIKFRAWEKHEKIMEDVHCVTFDFPQGGKAHSSNINSYWYKQGNIELMQYTGFKDKHGEDIYEGDVVGNYGIIEDLRKFYCWVTENKQEEKLEKYGNIYENEELIK